MNLFGNAHDNELLIPILSLSVLLMSRVMSRLSTYEIIWIVMFLFLDFVLTENKKYSGENTSRLNFQEKKLAHDVKNYWQDKPFHKSNLTETIDSKSLNKNLCLKSNQIAKNTSAKEYKNVMKDENRKTLIDYNDPTIMEDSNSKSDQDFTNHIRVKRHEPTIGSIVYRWNHSIKPLDSSLRSFCSSNNAMNVSDNLVSKLREPYVDLDRRNLPDVFYKTTADILHPKHKRGILSKNGERRKRMKGNTGHSRYRVGTQVKNSKHSTLKSSHRHRRLLPSFSPPRSENNTLNTGVARDNVTDEKVEINQEGDALLTNNRSFDEQQGGNVALPFVRIGKAELRVRIEKMPTNKSLFFNPDNWTDRSIKKTSYLLTPKDGIIDIDIKNPEITSNFDSFERKEVNNLATKSILKKMDNGNNVSSQETNDSGSTMLHDTDSRSVDSALQGIEDGQSLENGKTKNHTNKIFTESTDEDAKSRAKRNQEITCKNHRSNGINAIRLKYFKNAQKSIRNTKDEMTRNRKTHGDRAVRSIEQIKKLAEKLIIKVNELQVYVSNHNETLYTTDSCIEKNGVAIKKAPKISLEKQGVSNFKSKITASTDDCQHSHDEQATLIGQRASRMSSNASRFAREHRTRKRSRRKWGRWMDWSSCSVTCGKGRQIRWRHCLRDCHDAETEMEEKACQLPACPPGKFLGIF